MLKISQLISLPIINIYEVKIEGYIEKVVFNPNKKTAEYMVIYDENNDSYKLVKFQDVYKFGDGAVLIRNNTKITLYENNELEQSSLVSPINAQCYALDGNNMGKITDISITYGGAIQEIYASNNYLSAQIIGITNDLILVSPNKKVSIKNFRHLPKKIKPITTLNEPIVTILENISSPQIQPNNYNFLLNRKILKDIKNSSGEVIAHKDSYVNLNTIQKLKYYGKLKELTLNSK